ncbi:hypothetical protein LJC09_00580 [Desulfovibrio sp. OttesenSCG-928-F20]|nr:hypothetical protein [Desulfovibrio sp. OttesenSCG-928-M16]MDL2290587.1 hypothetical protein [Desulfovibrio sp. OttesenSCG-928-F20]
MSEELADFLNSWTEDTNQIKGLFLHMRNLLLTLDGVSLEYKGRPGVSHSLRARKSGQSRPLFVLIDVIDDDPAARWLSVCFYADLLKDPKELGDVVPGGLMGEDARCFDLEGPEQTTYILRCLEEAYNNS